MATLIERMKALLAESEEQEEEETADAGADTSAMQQENTQLKDRIAELEEQRTEHEALFTRVLDHLEVADDVEGAEAGDDRTDRSPSDGAGRSPGNARGTGGTRAHTGTKGNADAAQAAQAGTVAHGGAQCACYAEH